MKVIEALTFAANLKLKGTPEFKKEKVEHILKILNLKRCQNTFIGGHFLKGISGGERKRTSIGYGKLIIFFDKRYFESLIYNIIKHLMLILIIIYLYIDI
jgi:hypothetical protein